MFTWICPQCGREVPPAYNDCPDCSKKAAAGRSSPSRRPGRASAGAAARLHAVAAVLCAAAPQQQPPAPPPPPPYQRRRPNTNRRRNTAAYVSRSSRSTAAELSAGGLRAAGALSRSAHVADDGAVRVCLPGRRRRSLLAGRLPAWQRHGIHPHLYRRKSRRQTGRPGQSDSEVHRSLRRPLCRECQEEIGSEVCGGQPFGRRYRRHLPEM